jgi:hypothetical protein
MHARLKDEMEKKRRGFAEKFRRRAINQLPFCQWPTMFGGGRRKSQPSLSLGSLLLHTNQEGFDSCCWRLEGGLLVN